LRDGFPRIVAAEVGNAAFRKVSHG
jgi:hypothetical protein